MSKSSKSAAHLHEHVPPGWYFYSIKKNPFQKYWHKRRFEEIGNLIEKTSGKVLDIGCADGVFTNIIQEKTKAKKVIGIDVLKSSVDWAKKHWKKTKRMEFRVGDAHKLNFKAGSFDAVFALEMLEHVFEPSIVLKEIKRVLKRRGYAVFLVPSENFLFRAVVWPLWCKSRGKIWNHTHLHAYRKDYLILLCKKAGFEVEVNNKFILGMLQAIKVKKK